MRRELTLQSWGLYFPRAIDMSNYSQAKLSAVARQLSERHRKTLQYQITAEKFEGCFAAIC